MLKRPSHATVVAYLALFVALSGTAYAATGGNLILGRTNGESTKTVLVNSQGIPLGLTAKSGLPPLSVNSAAKVKNLNADLLDGKPASAFQTPLSVTVVTSEIGNVAARRSVRSDTRSPEAVTSFRPQSTRQRGIS